MQLDNVFIVNCERIPRRKAYYVKFDYNEQFIIKIKELPRETRKWSPSAMAWDVTIESLLLLIKMYRGSNKIRFSFGSDDSKKIFVDQIKKIEEKERERLRTIEELKANKEKWLNYKLSLETTYINEVECLHKYLNPNIRLYQHQITAALFMTATKNTLISHEMGLGKAQDLDSKLLTPNGWVRMGDIKINDFVVGSDGKPKRVLGVFPQGLKNIYEISFNDGTTARSCDEHLWNVNTAIRNWRKCKYKTKTLREIIDDGLNFKNGNNKNYIPIVKPIEFKENELKINPYVLGCLLGDGSITKKNGIGFSSMDQEIIDEITQRVPINHNMVKSINSEKDYYLTADGKNNYINQALKQYNLKGCNSYTKFIPEDFKFGSINQRLETLQGILDTDGHSRNDGIVELTLASKQLIQDVQFIVESLGGVGRLHDKWILYKGVKKLYYRLNIKLPSEFIPFKLKRKINTFVPPTKYPPNRAIIKVREIGRKLAQCILIDSEDHLYVTDHCILTHNTLSSILYVEMNDYKKVVVITPNSLKFNYYEEVNKFTKSKAHIVNWGKNGKKNKYTIEESKYIIVNYDYFNPSSFKNVEVKFNALKIGKIDCLILDECQKIKNDKSNIFKNFKKIFTEEIFVNEKESKIFLSGTPMPSRARELFNVLHQISPIDFATKGYFYEYYCGLTYDFNNGWGYEANEEDQKFEELFHKIAPYTHRKRKSECLKSLPEKTYQKIMLEMDESDQKIYNDIEDHVANEFVLNPTNNPLTTMIRLRQFTSSLKIKPIIELIENILETGEKVVVVDYFKDSLKTLKEYFGDVAGLHTGDQNSEVRAEIVKNFQDVNSDLKIFLGSIQTANFGLTLTAASKMFIISLPYTVGEYDQVADRIHRIGSLYPVNIYPMIFNDSIDEYVYAAIENKRQEIVKVMDNEDYKSTTGESVVSDVINKIKARHNK